MSHPDNKDGTEGTEVMSGRVTSFSLTPRKFSYPLCKVKLSTNLFFTLSQHPWYRVSSIIPTLMNPHSFPLRWPCTLFYGKKLASTEGIPTLFYNNLFFAEFQLTPISLFIAEFLFELSKLAEFSYISCNYYWLIFLESGLQWGFYLLLPNSTQIAFSKVTGVLLTVRVRVLSSHLILSVAPGTINYFLFYFAVLDNAPFSFAYYVLICFVLCHFDFSPFCLLITEMH